MATNYREQVQTRLRATLESLIADWPDLDNEGKAALQSRFADATPEALQGYLADGGWERVEVSRELLTARIIRAWRWAKGHDTLDNGDRTALCCLDVSFDLTHSGAYFKQPVPPWVRVDPDGVARIGSPVLTLYSFVTTRLADQTVSVSHELVNAIRSAGVPMDQDHPVKHPLDSLRWCLESGKWEILAVGLQYPPKDPEDRAGDWLRVLAWEWVNSRVETVKAELAKERERLALVLKPQGVPGKLLEMGGFDLLTPETAKGDRRLPGDIRVEKDDHGQIALIAVGNPVAVVKPSTLARMQDKGRLPTGVSNEVTDALTETLTGAAGDLRTYYGVSLFLWLARQANEQATAGCRSVTLVVPGGYSGLAKLLGFNSKEAPVILRGALVALEAFAPPFLGERYNLLHEVVEHKAAGGAAGSGQQAWLEIVVGLPLLGASVNRLACYKDDKYLVPLQTGLVIPVVQEQRRHKAGQVMFYMRVMDYLSRESLALVDRGGYAIGREELERWQDAAGLPRAVLTELWERYYMPPGAGLFQLLERTESGLFVAKEQHLDAFLRQSASIRKTARLAGQISAAKRRREHAPKK